MNKRIFQTAPLCIFAAAFVPMTSRPAVATQTVVEIEEWEVPWLASRPRDPYVAPSGNVWFVGQVGDYLAVLDPNTGEFQRFDLDDGTGPHNLVVDDNGIVWYAGNRAAHIGRLDPASGEIEKIPMPDPSARDPHTLVFDGRGNIWFTMQRSNFVGRLDMSSKEIDLVRVPTPRARPYGIVVDPRGRPWVAEFGTNRIATVDPVTLELVEYVIPREAARPRRLQLSSDGAVWYVDYMGGFVGRLNPETGEFTEWASPNGDDSHPYGMVIDNSDRIWYVETSSPNRFVGFDTTELEFIGSTDIPSGGGSVRHMFFDETTNSVWFGTDANTIGRARLP